MNAWRRVLAVMAKEFIQMRRDRLTFAMMIGVPVIQLTLFGFAINTDPKHLPSVVVAAHMGPAARALLARAEATGYFRLLGRAAPDAAERMMRRGEVQFVFWLDPRFEEKLARHERPWLGVIADATDPVAVGAPLAALARLAAQAPAPVDLRVMERYNPDRRAQNNIVPALMGVILTMTMVLITAVALARERERGTMEYLLATPVRPWEVIVGKIVPYIFVGYVQVGLILLAALGIFHVPVRGSLLLVLVLLLPFIAANLGLGVLFSTLARNQMQAMQMSFFFFLPSILLSGFMFPFRGMPGWAQGIGELLPLTHILRIVRGVLLKGAGLADVAGELVPILGFFAFSFSLALVRLRRSRW